ncbi:MAG: hypothetical protein ACRDYX_08255 [Egibacteraceae bacterium]
MGRHERRTAAARVAQDQPETKALLCRRPKVERRIAHLQRLGMRQARCRGRRKTRLQALLAATAADFARLGALGALGNAGPRQRLSGCLRPLARPQGDPTVLRGPQTPETPRKRPVTPLLTAAPRRSTRSLSADPPRDAPDGCEGVRGNAPRHWVPQP